MTFEARSARFERRDGREALAFGGSDYLGLAHESELRRAFVAGAERWGVSLAASRTTSGTCAEHEALERELAAFLGSEAALVVSCGSLANEIVCAALARERGRVWVHARAHASLGDAARGRFEDVRTFVEAREVERGAELVLVDGVDPFANRIAPLAELAERLAADGLLVVDEAHALGVLGASGRGALAACGVDPRRALATGSLSKAVGAVGGFLAGSERVLELARAEPAFVGSTALSPALAAVARAALALCRDAEERRTRLFRHVARLRGALSELGVALGPDPFPVFALALPSPERTAAVQRVLAARGVAVPNVRYLGDGPHGALRLTLNAAHEDVDIERLIAALREALTVPR